MLWGDWLIGDRGVAEVIVRVIVVSQKQLR
jgi:hypothetical protein